MTLRKGDQGPEVKKLQEALIALNYDVGKAGADGDYGVSTCAAVLAFQLDYTDLDDDGIAGPLTQMKIAQASAALRPAELVRCNAEAWMAFERFVDVMIKTPVGYGPGRGLWLRDRFVVTHGPGSLGLKSWKNMKGKSYPSFHCSSFTNFFLGWLLRRNDLYTHAGNIPDLLTQLLVQDATLHKNPNAGPWRGYGDACSRIVPDGSSIKRHGIANAMDITELYTRRSALPSFIVWGQSTKSRGVWKWWHHTGVLAIQANRMFRIAADGYRDASSGYSGQAMKWTEITDKNLGDYANVVYRAYGVDTFDGSYGDQDKVIATVEIET